MEAVHETRLRRDVGDARYRGTSFRCWHVGGWDEAQAVRHDADLRKRFEELGFGRWDEPGEGGWVQFARSLALAELTTSDDVDDQLQTVEEFCERVVGEILGVRR
jgi:hypothetical protein